MARGAGWRSFVALAVTGALPWGGAPVSSKAAYAVTEIHHSGRVPAGPVVGRVGCGGATWLVSSHGELSELRRAVPAVMTTALLRGMRTGEQPGGLGCADGQLWVLIGPRAVGRVDGGAIAERRQLPANALALFGDGRTLLAEALPLVPRRGVLTPIVFGEGDAVARAAWSGMSARAGSSTIEIIRNNLVACGLSDPGSLPCWFAGEAAVGLVQPATGQPGPSPSDDARSTGAPVVDAALSGRTLWTLRSEGQQFVPRQPSRKLRASRGEEPFIDIPLPRPARLIVSASPATCVLLGSAGELFEVTLS